MPVERNLLEPAPILRRTTSESTSGKPSSALLVCQVWLARHGWPTGISLSDGHMQVEGCGASLSGEKCYYQRYRVCKRHLKTLSLVVDGEPARFCQQCGRFETLNSFDGDKRHAPRVGAYDHLQRRRITCSRRTVAHTSCARACASKRQPLAKEPRGWDQSEASCRPPLMNRAIISCLKRSWCCLQELPPQASAAQPAAAQARPLRRPAAYQQPATEEPPQAAHRRPAVPAQCSGRLPPLAGVLRL